MTVRAMIDYVVHLLKRHHLSKSLLIKSLGRSLTKTISWILILLIFLYFVDASKTTFFFRKKNYPCSDYHRICRLWAKTNTNSCTPSHSSYPFMRAVCMRTCNRCNGEVAKYILKHYWFVDYTWADMFAADW